MASLNSHCPMLGSEIDIYIYSNRDLSNTVSNFTLRSKVVGVYTYGVMQADWLLAWDGTSTPSSKYSTPTYKHVGGAILQQSHFSPDVDQHHWYCWVNGNIEIATVHVQTAMNNTPPANLSNIASAAPTLPNIPVAAPVPTGWQNRLTNAINEAIKLKDEDFLGMPKTFGEAPCSNPTCRKMNDVGNPKITKCWNCCSKL